MTIGIVFESLSLLGKVPVVKDKLIIFVKGSLMMSRMECRILVGMLQGPVALLSLML